MTKSSSAFYGERIASAVLNWVADSVHVSGNPELVRLRARTTYPTGDGVAAFRSGAGEPAFQHLQLADLLDVEFLPSVRCTALALPAYLKAEQPLNAAPDPVVVGLHDSGSPTRVREFDQTPFADRTHKIVFHDFTRRIPSRTQFRSQVG